MSVLPLSPPKGLFLVPRGTRPRFHCPKPFSCPSGPHTMFAAAISTTIEPAIRASRHTPLLAFVFMRASGIAQKLFSSAQCRRIFRPCLACRLGQGSRKRSGSQEPCVHARDPIPQPFLMPNRAPYDACCCGIQDHRVCDPNQCSHTVALVSP